MINRDVIVFSKKNKVENPQLENPSVSIFAGATGTGKTNWMLNFLLSLQDSNQFQRALYVTSNKIDPLLENIGDGVEITNDPERLNDFIQEIKNQSKEEIKKNPSIMIFDDCQNSPIINIQNNKMLNSFVLSHRHYNTWLVFCVQTYKNSLSTAIRKMGSLLFLFTPRNEGEMQSILAELPINKQKLIKAFEIVSLKEHTPLYINLQEAKPKLFIGFKDEFNSYN